ncbi:hypothetical protein D910_05164 [Dendroctonus ponderosae]|uniref:Choline transporter-like protein n=1 Tax=Dendroctonus ponderosae TaxID=77166 RepID=U4UCU3_DENPD|nr:hypothetical protein D910_05164 [Dendroctonus ponderosae]
MCVGLQCFLIAYCVHYGDIDRVIHGYDNCGSVCGSKQTSKSSSKQMETCYKSIDNTQFGSNEFLNRCLPSSKKTQAFQAFFTKAGIKDFFMVSPLFYFFTALHQVFRQEICEDFNDYWKVLIYMGAISLGKLHLQLLDSLHFSNIFDLVPALSIPGRAAGLDYPDWSVSCLSGTQHLSMGVKELQKEDMEIRSEEVWTWLGLAIGATCATVILTLIICVMIKRIKLVIQLFEEAGKALAAMPLLLFEPILTFMWIIGVLSLCAYLCLWVSSSGRLRMKRPNIYYYKKDGLMEATKVLNVFGMFWMCQFVVGCQHLVIAGAVSKWNKSQLSSPIARSFYNLARFHLGSVALGSFCLATVQILRLIFTAMQRMVTYQSNSHLVWLAKTCLCLCNCCFWLLDRVLNVISRNAYILTAMYGDSFCRAGKQALAHLTANPLRVAAINSVGDFVLFLAKVLVVACSVAIGSYFLKHKDNLHHYWVPLALIGLFSYFIAHCFMTVYEMTIDTIFMCFCEDCELNDGASRPYFMSRGLMEFVEDSKNASGFHAVDPPVQPATAKEESTT